jgi:nitric-oxide synthase
MIVNHSKQNNCPFSGKNQTQRSTNHFAAREDATLASMTVRNFELIRSRPDIRRTPVLDETHESAASAIFEAARAFITTCYEELGLPAQETAHRLTEIADAINATGTYQHTLQELVHGARMAWRNSNRCIGRYFWNRLQIRDKRAVVGTDNILAEIEEHIRYATNGGKIIPTMTIFRQVEPNRPPLRVLNYQIIRYAGYAQPDGTIIGDPMSVEFTRTCMAAGWQGSGGPYDLLPVVLQDGDTLVYHDLPPDIVLEVPLTHPEEKRFAELGLKWYAVPIISSMELQIGGVRYTAAPFNGWYMGTEIGARNLADEARYNKLPAVAELFGLDTKHNISLWHDRALVELNRAVLYSFAKAGVTIVDHHTAAKQFAQFEAREATQGRHVTGEWSWLIPPVSPATTHIWHKSFDNTHRDPSLS